MCKTISEIMLKMILLIHYTGKNKTTNRKISDLLDDNCLVNSGEMNLLVENIYVNFHGCNCISIILSKSYKSRNPCLDRIPPIELQRPNRQQEYSDHLPTQFN